MKKIPNYPKTENGRNIYVRYPVQVTKADQSKFIIRVKVGQWVAANVLHDGYQHLQNPYAYTREVDCLKACTISNKLHGWTEDEANSIISQSMENSIPSEPKRKLVA